VPGPISVTSTTANIGITNQGPVTLIATQTGPALNAVSTGGGNVTISSSGTVTTAAAGAPGVYASTAGGAGIVSVTTTGAITATGAGSNGVVANNLGTGTTSVTVGTVTASGTGAIGVLAEGTGTSALSVTVASGGTVTGTVYGVQMTTTGGSLALTNNGTINGGTAAIATTPGSTAPITVTNTSTGVINGPVLFGNSGNTLNNAGTWNISGASIMGTSGTGTNVINNTGGTVVVSGGTVAAPTTIAALNTFNNAGGAVDISTNHSLDITPAVFNGGAGSTLKANANGPDGILTVGSTGTGTTNVVPVDILHGAAPALDFTGIPIVHGASLGSFTIGGPGNNNFNAGFVSYQLVFTPATTGATPTPSVYSIIGVPGPAVFEALNIPYALQLFWRNSTAAFDARTREIRDEAVANNAPTREGWEFWFQPYGGHDKYDTFHQVRFPVQDPSLTKFNLIGTNNSNVGLQFGGDSISKWRSGYAFWGFTAGLEQQQTFFQGGVGNQDDLYSLGGNIGVYGGGNFGGFYFDGIGKADFVDMNMNFNSAQFSPTHTFEVWGTRGEIGYRWPFMGFFVEPAARVSAEWTDTDTLHPLGAVLHYNNDEPIVIGDVGGRVGTTLGLFGYSYSVYGGAFWTDQWDGKNHMSFTTFGGAPGLATQTTILLTQPNPGSAIKIEYGAETAAWYGGFKGFFEGANIVGGDGFGSWSARMGVRFNF
jgi:hypothetical protein